jgi:hypothetical protein
MVVQMPKILASHARWLSPTLAASLCLVLAACPANTYRISRGELQRLAQIAPENRGQEVEVEQELGGSDTASQPAVSDSTEVYIGPRVYVGGGVGSGPREPSGGGHSGGGRSGGGGVAKSMLGSDAKEAAAVVIILAVTALVTVAVVEGSRFAGDVQIHPMHPLHLYGRDGGYTVMPLAALDADAATWADHAVVNRNEGPWRQLRSNPLTRDGWTYGMMFGAGTVRSRDTKTDRGNTVSIELGHFFGQQLGLLGFAQFAWRDNAADGTVFEQRYGAQLQFMPLQAGPLSLGGYGGIGFSRSFEDGINSYTNYTVAAPLGLQAQFELHTNIALTARAGVVHSQGEGLREVLVGVSVY